MIKPSSSLAVVLMLAATTTVSAQNPANVELETQEVAGSVHMIVSGMAGNVGVSAGEDGILIVDDKFAPLADKIREALAGISPGELEFVVNTHWHGDHTGANEVFGQDALIVAHHNVRKRLMTGASGGGREVPPAPKVALPVVTYDDGIVIHFNGEAIHVRHLPAGHTDGDSWVWFEGSNVAHLGDDFFAGLFPFVDLASGGDVEGLVRNIAHLLEELPADVKIIPGHGPLADLDDLKSFHQMLEETVGTVRTAKEAGKSAEEIKGEGLGEKWQGWSWAFISEARWIDIIYASLE